ncbi:hypothetical protein QMK19_27070 [Streptomyces sp. H10-C2]|uniref:hypothetical protein n=1 Tax=unclassified Streptomyces TaxID=2593676 RepID=UPI0024B9A3C4|nr:MULTISPECIES: hypothetical protein [unclassified Streptomyces]MDJ0344623.1 hypothetical protein [Streptomyces sp. PH10-H1]MDJ0373217.1 hypothetical protein [Streptomyces sp. H10-C2]
MPIFGIRRSARPRLAPELDDSRLGRVCKQLQAPPTPGLVDIQIEQVAQVIRDAETDWDRRAHRSAVLADRAADSHLAQAWLRRQPDNADALILQARVDLVLGSREGALADAQSTIDTCHRAADLQPDDPTPWVVLLGVLRLMHRPSREVFPVWHEVLARDTWHREAYLQMLGYLSPDECGSHAQVLDFIDVVRSRMPSDAPAVSMELTAGVERHRKTVRGGGVNAILASRQWANPPASTALDQAFNNWTKPGFLHHAAALADLNLLAYTLVQANRILDAAEAFRMIGTTVTPWPWRLNGDPLEQFAHWQERALR